MTPQEREARLRAARRLQDDIYQGIGATDRPDVDDRPVSGYDRNDGPDGGRAATRRYAESLTRGGTQPLRDELARDSSATARMAQRDMDADEDDSQMMSRAKMDDDNPFAPWRKVGKKPKGGY